MITIIQSPEFKKWLHKLKDYKAKTIVDDRLLRLQAGNFGDAKSVGDGLQEIRIQFGPGYRLYFIQVKLVVVVLLTGGDKSSQIKDIKKAKILAKKWK